MPKKYLTANQFNNRFIKYCKSSSPESIKDAMNLFDEDVILHLGVMRLFEETLRTVLQHAKDTNNTLLLNMIVSITDKIIALKQIEDARCIERRKFYMPMPRMFGC